MSDSISYYCYGCEGDTASVRRAFDLGEPCPICGLDPTVAAVIQEARTRHCEPSTRDLSTPLSDFVFHRLDELPEGNPFAEAWRWLAERVFGWPRRPDEAMYQRDEDILRIAALPYVDHPDYDPAWNPR